jgi:hypothetical protein
MIPAGEQRPQVRRATVAPAVPAVKEPAVRPESSWHVSARIVYPGPGKSVRLNDQAEEAKLVIRGGIKLLETSLILDDAFLEVLSRAGTGKTYMLAAAEKIPEAVYIKERLAVDPAYASVLADLVRLPCINSGMQAH